MAASAPVAADHHRWQHYLNARFGTHADYPADLFTQPHYPENGDGVRWTGRGGLELSVYGSWNVLEHNSKNYEAFLKEGFERHYAAISYREVTPDLLALSGVANGRVYYERHEFGDRAGVIHSMVIEYPVAMRQTIDPLIARMSRSLGWAK